MAKQVPLLRRQIRHLVNDEYLRRHQGAQPLVQLAFPRGFAQNVLCDPGSGIFPPRSEPEKRFRPRVVFSGGCSVITASRVFSSALIRSPSSNTWVFCVLRSRRLKNWPYGSLAWSRQVSNLDTWLAGAANSDIMELHGFAQGIRQDYEVVSNALTSPVSNGQTEGQVNRLKMIKRKMYGRGNFDLLRRRVLQPI